MYNVQGIVAINRLIIIVMIYLVYNCAAASRGGRRSGDAYIIQLPSCILQPPLCHIQYKTNQLLLLYYMQLSYALRV